MTRWADAHRRVSLSQLAAAEVLRICTTPVVWILLIGGVALAILTMATGISTAEEASIPLVSRDGLRLVFASAVSAWIFSMALGVLGMAGEYRHRTASATFLAEPLRWRVFVAKVMAHGLFGLVFGLVTGAATLGIGWVWLRALGARLAFARDLWLILGGALIATALYAMLGVGIGALVRSQVGAVAAVLGWSLIEASILANLWPEGQRYFPNAAASALTPTPGADVLSVGMGELVFGGYVLAFLLLGLQSVRRRDVPG